MHLFPLISRIMTGDGSIDAAKNTYNVFFTSHAIIMIFFMVMPAMMGGFRQLDGAAPDRRAGHGVSQAQQPVVLAAGGRSRF